MSSSTRLHVRWNARPRIVANALLLTSLVLVSNLSAQQSSSAPPATTPSAEKDETLVLSPFEVTASEETGYVAQDSLAGSRVRTQLKDLAAAISPMTAEFLKDIAATNLENAMEYGVGTRIDTDDGRTGGVAEGFNDGIRTFRVRGLKGASRTINFFDSPSEIDLYLTDRVEVSRGPNAILFGFGAPAGRINVMTKQAMTNKNAYSFTNRIDSWEGLRFSFDANQVLIPDKLAIRAVGLLGREKSWRAAGHTDQDRLFLASKWNIDTKTTLKVEFEQAKVDRIVPRPFGLLDLKSTWEASGQPINFNNFSASYVPGSPSTGAVGQPGNPIQDAGATNVIGVRAVTGGDWITVSPDFQYAQNFRRFTVSDSPTGANQAIDYDLARRNPDAVPEANWLSGDFSQYMASAFLQRELLPNLNVELALNRTDYDKRTTNLTMWGQYGLAVDTNKFLPNGQLRPAENLYYFDQSPYIQPASVEKNQGRLTASYEKKFGRLLTLRLGGMYEASYQKQRTGVFQQYWLNGPEVTSGGAFNPTPENDANLVRYRYYVDPNDIYKSDFRIPGPMDLSGGYQYQDPLTGQLRTVYAHYINRNAGNATGTDDKNRAHMWVAQGYFLDNSLVVTAGLRKDRLDRWSQIALRDPAGEAIAPGRGVLLPVDPRELGKAPLVAHGKTETLGGVLHLSHLARKWLPEQLNRFVSLSGFYNYSTSVGIAPGGFITFSDPTNPVLTPRPTDVGVTDDYGLKLSLLGDRLYLTATRFHTAANNQTNFSGFGNSKTAVANPSGTGSIWYAIANSGLVSDSEKATALAHADVLINTLFYTESSDTRGTELELVGSPVKGWTISVNYSKNESTRAGLAKEWRNYLNHWKPYWLQFGDLSLSQNVNLPGAELSASPADFRTPDEILATADYTINRDSVLEAVVDAESEFYEGVEKFDGNRFIGDPKHNYNLRTRYDFSQGKLKGLSVGLGVRIRTGRVAGAKTSFSVPAGSDYTAEKNGREISAITIVEAEDQNVYDAQIGYKMKLFNGKVRWDIQLNVNNLTNERKLITQTSHAVTLAPLLARYQDPRQFILTNTFSF